MIDDVIVLDRDGWILLFLVCVVVVMVGYGWTSIFTVIQSCMHDLCKVEINDYPAIIIVSGDI